MTDMRRVCFFMVILTTCFAAVFLYADNVYFKKGGVQKGLVISETDSEVTMRTSFGRGGEGVATYKKVNIEKVERTGSDERRTDSDNEKNGRVDSGGSRKKSYMEGLKNIYEKVHRVMKSVKNRALSDNGKPAPGFTLLDMYGGEFSLSDTKGKVVILDFWATWCPPCKKELPHFEALQHQYESEGLKVVGISLDRGNPEKLKEFVSSNRLTYSILVGTREVADDYGGIKSIPTTFIIDREGNIVEKFIGYRDRSVFENAIKKLL